MPLRRIWRALLVPALLLAAFAIVPTVKASCAGPTASILERHAAPGERVSIRGQNWATECNDVVTCSQGCFGTRCTGGEPSPFARGLVVDIRPQRPGARWRTIATGIDAGPGYRIAAQIALPEDLTLGRYDVRVRGGGLEAVVPDGLAVVVVHL
jgi:hypothetical protein